MHTKVFRDVVVRLTSGLTLTHTKHRWSVWLHGGFADAFKTDPEKSIQALNWRAAVDSESVVSVGWGICCNINSISWRSKWKQSHGCWCEKVNTINRLAVNMAPQLSMGIIRLYERRNFERLGTRNLVWHCVCPSCVQAVKVIMVPCSYYPPVCRPRLFLLSNGEMYWS